MPVIHIETEIAAPPKRVFDLARSIDAHQDTASASNERAIAGVTAGLLGPDQEYRQRCSRRIGRPRGPEGGHNASMLSENRRRNSS